ncbi:hypothetical protein BGZ83_003849 [Gryganskiella cystojenkinii]|nr:hypothetical protein BGZ83_003849 [Gryganskiella cystojenkinii]
MHSVPITLEREAYSAELNLILYPLSKYDLILGKPRLTHVDPKIRWKTNTLYLNHNQQPITWICRGFRWRNIKSRTRRLFHTHMHFHTMTNLLGSSVFLALIRQREKNAEDDDEPPGH